MFLGILATETVSLWICGPKVALFHNSAGQRTKAPCNATFDPQTHRDIISGVEFTPKIVKVYNF